MRALFAGTPAIAIPALKALSSVREEGGFCELAGVLTNPDAAKGRSGAAEPSEVGAAAAEIVRRRLDAGQSPPVIIKSETIDGDCFSRVKALKADILASFAYGTIFPDEFLALFPMGGVNVHPSLLPRYRGAAPIPAAIMNRDGETGVTVQRLAAELDSGNILLQETIPLTGRETSASLSRVAAEKGAAILVRALRALAEGAGTETPQNHAAATFCGKLEREDGRIDWRQSALDIDARIRAFTPWPLSFTRVSGKELYILEAAPYADGKNAGAAAAGTVLGADKNAGVVIQTGDGLLAARRLQFRTRRALDWKDFLNGARNFIGSTLE